MPRVSENEVKQIVRSDWCHGPLRDLACDLQDARTALKAIADWKHRPTDEAPLTYIARVAKEVVG